MWVTSSSWETGIQGTNTEPLLWLPLYKKGGASQPMGRSAATTTAGKSSSPEKAPDSLRGVQTESMPIAVG